MSYINTNVEKFQGVLPKNKEYKFTRYVKQNNIIDEINMTFIPVCTCKKLDKHNYVNLKTGEVNGFMPKIEGIQMRNRRSLRKIFTDLRYRITTNFEGKDCEKFVTLTYDEQTNDPKQIHMDLKLYNQRLKRAYKGIGFINIVEPHASGNFHVHSLLKRCNGEPLNMTYEDIFKLWGHGYVTVEDLQSVDHIGAYFIAYFSNMELTDAQAARYDEQNDITEKNGKKYIKGKRLDFYPDYMQIYRASHNLKKPEHVSEFDKNDYNNRFEVTYKLTNTDADGNTAESYINKKQHKKK